MNITLINKFFNSGGAAIACRRLFVALQNSGIVHVRYLFQTGDSPVLDTTFARTAKSGWKIYFNLAILAWEKFCFLFSEKSKTIRWNFSTAIAGEKIASHSFVKDPDILHLHWFNQGFISIKGLKNILALNKPVVWTLHDMWAFTGGCHYNEGCDHYKTGCSSCPMLKRPAEYDLSFKIASRKKELYNKSNICFVTCSEWLATEARNSNLLKDQKVVSIPNPIDTDIFKPLDKADLRRKYNLNPDKKIVLFGSAKITDKRKGFDFLIKAVNIILNNNPELRDKIEFLIFGNYNREITFPCKTNYLSFIKDEQKLAEIYNLADVFVLPSLQDNLPNTVMESLTCGTPVVAFNTGGVPEMVKHKGNGYLSQLESSEDLAKGIQWVLFESDWGRLSAYAREFALSNYSQKKVAWKYLSLYKELMHAS